MFWFLQCVLIRGDVIIGINTFCALLDYSFCIAVCAFCRIASKSLPLGITKKHLPLLGQSQSGNESPMDIL
jgi:hypothetical protein